MKRYEKGIIIMSIGTVLAVGALIMMGCVWSSDNILNKSPFYIVGLIVLLVTVPLAIAGYVMAHNVTNTVKANMSRHLKVDEDPNPDFRKEIETVRENFAADTDPNKNMTLKGVGPNKWLHDRSVIATGKIRYGYVVEANNEMFRFKDLQTVSLPGVVIYSTDEYYDSNPMALKKIAYELYRKKRSNELRNELRYFAATRLPDELTEGRAVYMTTIMFYRLHLPLGYLTDSLLPLVADPEHTGVFVVDVKYWTGPLIGNFVHSYAIKYEDKPETNE